MNVSIHASWEKALRETFASPEFTALTRFVKKAYSQSTCFPPGPKIFQAFDRCPFDQVKVVLLGQDPYHGVGQAHGLSFSVPPGIAHPPSLVNIFKEIQADLGHPYPQHGDLTAWADQGVLLLNATLTVQAHQAGSHQGKGWEAFTDRVIATLAQQREQLVFLLWGNYAKKKARWIDRDKHLILTAGHPSPLSANRGLWFGNRHFSQCNHYLSAVGKKPIDWALPA